MCHFLIVNLYNSFFKRTVNMWCTSNKLFSSILEGKNFLLSDVVLDALSFLPFKYAACLSAVLQFAPRNALCFTSPFTFPELYIKLSIVSHGRTNLLQKLLYGHWFNGYKLVIVSLHWLLFQVINKLLLLSQMYIARMVFCNWSWDKMVGY